MIDIILSLIFTALIILHTSWIVLLFYPKKYPYKKGKYPGISIIIPAHNEEKFIKATIRKALFAHYKGKREVMVVNDHSTDKTAEVVKKISSQDERVRLFNTRKHAGKANAINLGLKKAQNKIVITLDADSELKEDALIQIVKPFSDPKIAAVSGIVRAKDSKNPLTWFQDFEYILSSGWRFICNKVNGTYIFPGFAAFRQEILKKIGGFSQDTFSEDFDIGLRLKKEGYKLGMSKAIIFTGVPETLRGFIRQRVRWGRGTIQVMKKHYGLILNKRYGAVGLYGLPTQLYWYLHGFIYIPILFYQVFSGYLQNFVSYQNYLSFEVGKYFFSWFSVYGMIEYTYKTFMGIYQSNFLFFVLLIMFSLYIFYDILMLMKFSRINLKSLLVIFFFFPYSLFSLSLQVFPFLYEIGKKSAVNKWEKSK